MRTGKWCLTNWGIVGSEGSLNKVLTCINEQRIGFVFGEGEGLSQKSGFLLSNDGLLKGWLEWEEF